MNEGKFAPSLFEVLATETKPWLQEAVIDSFHSAAVAAAKHILDAEDLPDLLFPWVEYPGRAIELGATAARSTCFSMILMEQGREVAWLETSAKVLHEVVSLDSLPHDESRRVEILQQRNATLGMSWSDEYQGRVISRSAALYILSSYLQSQIGEAFLSTVAPEISAVVYHDKHLTRPLTLLGCLYQRKVPSDTPQLTLGELFIVESDYGCRRL